MVQLPHKQTRNPEPIPGDLGAFRAGLATKSHERERMLSLYRRGAIDDATLDRQLASIPTENQSSRKN